MYGAKTKGAVQPFFSALSPPSLWPVKPRARRLSTPRCGNEDRSRCAADLYRRGMFYVARGCVREGTTGTRAEERVALSDSKRPRGTPRMRDRGPPRRSIVDRSQVQGVPRTNRLWSYTPGSGGLCNASVVQWCEVQIFVVPWGGWDAGNSRLLPLWSVSEVWLCFSSFRSR